jgi:hypothetical protein
VIANSTGIRGAQTGSVAGSACLPLGSGLTHLDHHQEPGIHRPPCRLFRATPIMLLRGRTAAAPTAGRFRPLGLVCLCRPLLLPPSPPAAPAATAAAAFPGKALGPARCLKAFLGKRDIVPN